MNTFFRPCIAVLACLCNCASADESQAVLHLSANYWEPYTGENLPRQGIATAIVVTALARAGYRAEVTFMPWSRALATTYQGKFDGIVAVWSTSQRRIKLNYSDSYLSNELYLFYSRPGLCDQRALNSPGGIQIGVGRDYDYSDSFLAKYGSALRPVDRVQQNLLKLRMGRVDMVLEDKRILEYNIVHGSGKIAGTATFHCPESPLLTLPLYFGLNRDYPNAQHIISAFNLQLKAMKKDGTLDVLVKNAAGDK